MPSIQPLILGRPHAGAQRLWDASERMVQAVAHPIRIRILTALNTRSMSPKEFSELYPQYPLPTVAKHFHRLKALDYVEEVGRGPYGSRIFGIRTVRFIDQSSLIRLGAARQDWTGAVSSSYAERIAEAIGGSTFASRADSRFLWTPLLLDERAWIAAIMAMDALFFYGFWLHIEAAARLEESGEDHIVATVGLGCFQSPDDGVAMPIIPPMRFDAPAEAEDASELLVDEAIIKAFGHPVRIKILAALNRGPMSPKEFCEQNPKYGLQVVAKHFRRLENLGWIEVLRERTGIGDATVFCLRPQPGRFDQSNYAALPGAIRQDAESVLVTTYLERLADAVVANTINRRPESHLTWTGFHYDDRAWKDLVTALDSVYHYALLLQHHSVRRRDSTAGDGIQATLACACFPSPHGARTVDHETLAEVVDRAADPRVRQLGDYLGEIIKRMQEQQNVDAPVS